MFSLLRKSDSAGVSSVAAVENVRQRECLIRPSFQALLNGVSKSGRLAGKRAVVVLYSYYARDPRPKREAEALRRQGMEVDVICLRRTPNLPLREQVEGVNVFRVPLARRRAGKLTYITQYTSFFLSAFTFITMRHLRKRYDLVHVHNMPDFLVFTALVPRLAGAKVLLDLHDPTPELFQGIYASPNEAVFIRCLKKVERLSIAFADRVLTPNLAFAELFASRSCPREKIEIVMNSPEERMFEKQPPTRSGAVEGKNTYDLIYHGLLAERQGVDLAVRAVHALRHRIPNVKLHLYGEPTPYGTQVMRLVKQLNLEDKVTYHGFKSLQEVPSAIVAADLGLVPNRLSPFTAINMPTRIFEYLALNRPVIVPRTQGIQDYFTEDEVIFFEPGKPEDLADKIEWAYAHPKELQCFVTKGRGVYDRHRWELEEEKFIDLTRTVLAP